MSRIAILVYHDTLPDKVVTFSDGTTDVAMVKYVADTFGALHKIKRLHLCTEDAVHTNESPIASWLKTTTRLTS